MGTGATCERQRLDKGVSPALAASIVPPRAVPAFAIIAQVSAAEYDPMNENNQATAQITNEAPAKDGGCSVTPGQAPSGSRGMLWLGLLLAGLVVRRSRRSRSAAAAL